MHKSVRRALLWSATPLRKAGISLTCAVACLSGCADHQTIGDACELLPGDLVITEIMPNPKDDDSGREWFEIYNASRESQTLDRLTLMRFSFSDGGPILKRHFVRVAGELGPGEYFVFGNGAVGAAPVDYSYDAAGESFGSLPNERGGVAIACKDRQIDAVWYGDTSAGQPEVQEGFSLAFDGFAPPDAILNDRGEAWCSRGERFDGVNVGTPGERNVGCGIVACEGIDGDVRDAVPPDEGDLVITEVFGNPSGPDENREWIEIFVAADSAVDLNGVEIRMTSGSGATKRARVEAVGCIEALPGRLVVIASSLDSTENGGVEADAEAPELYIYNGGGTLELRIGTLTIDTAQVPEMADDVSVGIDPGTSEPAANDSPDDFCEARTQSVFDGDGTPGLPNDPCASICFESGGWRPIRPPVEGELIVTEVLADPVGVDNTAFEWVEVYVAAAARVDLNGLTLRNTASSTRSWMLTGANCVAAQPASYMVLAIERDAGIADATLVGRGDNLFNTQATITLSLAAEDIDTASYDPPYNTDTESASLQGAPDSSANDDLANWCTATVSAGEANAACVP